MWHGYFGIENLALGDQQRAALVAALRALGPDPHLTPACLNHGRARPNGDAAIDHDLTYHSFAGQVDALIAVFSRTATVSLRLTLFGGLSATWIQSGGEARAYLAANAQAWGERDA